MRRCRSPAEGTSWPLLTAVDVCVNKTTSSPCGTTSELKDEKIKETQTKKTTRRLKVSSAPRRWSCVRDTTNSRISHRRSRRQFLWYKTTTPSYISKLHLSNNDWDSDMLIWSVTWPRAARWDEGLDDTFRKRLNVRTWCWTAVRFTS